MSKGILKVITDKSTYLEDIIHLSNEDSVGEYNPSQNEFKKLTYDLGYCESYDIEKDEKIEYIEVEEWDVGLGIKGSVEVELVKSYFDHNNNCVVIEFK